MKKNYLLLFIFSTIPVLTKNKSDKSTSLQKFSNCCIHEWQKTELDPKNLPLEIKEIINIANDFCIEIDIYPDQTKKNRKLLFIKDLEENHLSMAFAYDHCANKVLGFVWYCTDHNKIRAIAVAKNEQGRGVGKMLIDYVIEKIKACGGTELRLEVAFSNEKARALYKKIGFEEIPPHMIDYILQFN